MGERRVEPLETTRPVSVSAPLPSSVPSYWMNQELSGGHVRQRCDVSGESRELFQALLDQSFKSRSTRDRQGAMPKRLRLLRCHRLEDSSLWSLYTSSGSASELLRKASFSGMEQLKQTWPLCTPISEHYTAQARDL